MEEKNKQFHFEFSLEVLNHLGRGLYRSFATVIAEAISNSWDAEATEVKISIRNNKLIVEDNGKGMDASDFQGKFLNVGYARRQDPQNKSKRIVIGRKGIGKLAMLSISHKVTILSKKSGCDITGGKINNSTLDKEISQHGNYFLDNLSKSDLRLFKKKEGTIIIFEDLKTKQNKDDLIRKYIATQFNFMFSIRRNDSFEIKVNNKKVSEKDLTDLNENTQFLWFLGEKNEDRKRLYKNLAKDKVIANTSFNFEGKIIKIRGFIASVKHPRHLLLRGSSETFKASINLFCNGRLRQENLFEEITSKMIAEEYLYGEVHVDGLEDEQIDRFTSSREGIIKDDPLYQKFLSELKKIQSTIMNDWTPWRNDEKDEGDIDVDKRPSYEVRLNDSKNRRAKDFQKKISENIEDKNTQNLLKEKLRSLSYKNTLVYQDLFILENIFREYIKLKEIKEKDLDDSVPEEAAIKKVIKEVQSNREKDEERHALKGKIVKNEHYLNNLFLFELGEIIDCKINKVNQEQKKYRKPLESDTKEISPIRNTIMHTVEVTDDVINWDKIKNVIDYIERLSNKHLKNKINKKPSEEGSN
jgi:hypothetical protein